MTATTIRLHADHATEKRLGHWTTATSFEVRQRWASTMLDLRSPRIEPGDIEVRLDADHATLILLVPDDAAIDQTDLRWTGRGRVKDSVRAGQGAGRVIRLVGHIKQGEVRVHRGGIAMLSAMFSRAYVEDLRRAHRDGGVPTVDDPTRVA